MNEAKVKRIIYCYDDGNFKQIEGEELANFVENFEKAHMCAVIHGHVFNQITWENINLEHDSAQTVKIGN